MAGSAGPGDGADPVRLGERCSELGERGGMLRGVHGRRPLRMPSSESTWLRFLQPGQSPHGKFAR